MRPNTHSLRATLYLTAVIASIAMIALGLGAAQTSRDKNASLFYARALEVNQVREHVSVRGTRYVVDGATVSSDAASAVPESEALAARRLAYALTLAKRQPLMAIPGTDPDELDAVLETMDMVARELGGLQSDREHALLIEEALYPTDFLRAMTDLERARSRFIEKGTDDSWNDYDAALLSAFSAFDRDLFEHERAFRRIVPVHAAPYQVFGGVITRDRIIESFGALRSGARERAAQNRQRTTCLRGHIGACDMYDLSEPALVMRSPSADAATQPYITEIRSAYATATRQPAFQGGPVYRLADSVCLSDRGVPPLFSVQERRRGVPESLTVEFIGDIFFLPARSVEGSAYHSYFDDNDVRYIYFPLWEHYKCPQLVSDTSRVFQMMQIRDLARTTPISSSISRSAQGDDVRSTESVVATGRDGVVYETDTVRYLDAARRALASTENRPDLEETVRGLVLADRYRSVRLDLFARRVIADEAVNIGLMQKGVPVELDAKYLFYVQSGFFSLFLGNNPSVVGMQEPPYVEDTSERPSPFVTFSGLRSTESYASLVHDMSFFFGLHNRASTAIPIDI